MTKAKQTSDQYNQTREEGISKLQPLFDEKNKGRETIKELFGDTPEEMKKQSKAMRSKLNAQWKEDNKDLIAKYQELYQQKKLDEATFKRGLEEFRKLDPDIDEQALWNLLMGKLEKTESKETLTKSLEFEEDTFKIDSKGWEEEKMECTYYDAQGIPNTIQLKVKVNATGDVIEYLEGPARGEQIFTTYGAFIREVMKAKNCSREEVEKKYLMTVDEFQEKMKDKLFVGEGKDEYRRFFNEEIKGHLAGQYENLLDTIVIRSPYTYDKYISPGKRLFDVGRSSCVWLVGGHYARFCSLLWEFNDNLRPNGSSGRLLKN